jgi:glycosyltransferase involved in cell wall biosynthesis
VIKQSFQDWEVLLIDDRSPDGSGALCDELVKRDGRIKVLHKEANGGTAKARLDGVRLAQGEYIAFLDADDYLEPNAYEVMFQNLLKYDADILECAYFDDRDGESIPVKKEKDVYEMTVVEAFQELHNVDFNNDYLWNKLFKKECVVCQEEARRVAIGEDYSMLIKCYEKCQKIVFINECLYHYVFRANSVCNRGYSDIYVGAIDNWKEQCAYLCEKYPSIQGDVVARTLYQEVSALTAMTKNKTYDKAMIKRVTADVRAEHKKANKKSLKLKLVFFTVRISGSFFLFLYRLLPKKFR